jgi:O-antigen ligase
MDPPSWDTLRHRFDTAGRWMAVATAFSLVVSTALCTVTMVLFLAFWIASGHYREKLSQIQARPLALCSLALLMMLVIGVLYSAATLPQALNTLRSYRELLYLPLLLTAFDDQKWQRRGYYAFLIAMLLILTLSYAKFLGWLPLGPPGQEYTVFKGRIAHSLLMAYTIYLWAQHFVQEPRRRWLWGLLIALGLVNLLFMISGRTGYLVFFTTQIGLVGLALLLLLGYRQWRLSYALRPEFIAAAQGLVVTLAVGSLFNSLLLDFTEGHFYACLTGIYYGSFNRK